MKRRYKLLIGFIITSIILILIFFITIDDKIYYLSLGDSLSLGRNCDNNELYGYSDYLASYLNDKDLLEYYSKNFSNESYRSIDILSDLNKNKTIYDGKKKITIKNALIKADIVTLSIGMNDIFYKLNIANSFEINNYNDIYSYIDETFIDMDKMLYQLRKSCKEQIIVLGYYNPFLNYNSKLSLSIEPFIVYSNNKLKSLLKKYDMTYLDLHDTFYAHEEYLSSNYDFHPTKKGYEAIGKKIIDIIN